jgi:hypothetical protein
MRLAQELVALDGGRRASTVDVRRVEKSLRAKLTEWLALFQRHSPVARQMLAELIDGRLTFSPDFDTRSYTFAGTATFDKLIRGIVEENGKPLVWRSRPAFVPPELRRARMACQPELA